MGINVDNGVETRRCLLHAVMRGLLGLDVVLLLLLLLLLLFRHSVKSLNAQEERLATSP